MLATGIVVFVYDILRPKKHLPICKRNPWGAGTLEWLAEMPDKPWGVRSIPEIDGRYPLWDQPNPMRDVDEGRFYLPDALRVGGRPTFLTHLAALVTGGLFILSTFHLYRMALASGVIALGVLLVWLWTGTAQRFSYMCSTLAAYASGRRHSGIMQPVAASLSDRQMRALARWYSTRRQQPAYLEQQLRLFARGARGGTEYANLMQATNPHDLNPEEVRAVARYYPAMPRADAASAPKD